MKPSGVLDHATREIASGSKLGNDATKKLPGEGFESPWPPMIRMNDDVKRKMAGMRNGVNLAEQAGATL